MSNPGEPYFHALRAGPSENRHWRVFFALRVTEIENIFDRKGNSRLQDRLMQKQINLINAIYQPEIIHGVEYRFCARPPKGKKLFRDIEIYIIVSTNHKEKKRSLRQARENYHGFIAILQSSFRLYTTEAIREREAFMELFNQPRQLPFIREVRRRVSRLDQQSIIPRPRPKLSLAPLEKKSVGENDDTDKSILAVHPFIPVNSGYDKLFKLLGRVESPVFVSIRISPTRIRPEEDQYFVDSIRECETIVRENVKSPRLNREQADILARILLSHYLSLQDAPFAMHIFLASQKENPFGLAELLGTEVTRPVGGTRFEIPGEKLELLSGYSGGYDINVPQNSAEHEDFTATLMMHDNDRLVTPLADKPSENRLQFLYDASEAACAFHLPHSINDNLSGFPLRMSKVYPMPGELFTNRPGSRASGIIGVNNYLGVRNVFCLPDEARRRHMYIVGQTGTGKSSILKSMILADIGAGKGVGVFDPHGDLIDYILARIPAERMEQVVLIDPTIKEYAVGVNIMEADTLQQKNFIVQEIISMAMSLYDPGNRHGFAGPVFENMSRMALQAIMSVSDKKASFLDFPLFFYDHRFRKSILTELGKKKYRHDLDPFLDLGLEAMQRHEDYHGIASWVVAKYGRVISDPSLRAILCQEKSTISFRDIMDNKKILLVNLNKSKMGALGSEWLGMFLLTKLQAAAMKRVDIPEARRQDFYLYIDEFQNSATENFADILAESRKYRLNLTLANQYVAQIPVEMRKAIFGNVGTIIALRVGQDDAELLEGQFLPQFTRDDFIRLPNWKGVVASTATGKRLAPFTMDTIPFENDSNPSKGHLQKLKKEITARHGIPKKEYEKYYVERIGQIMGEQ